MSGEPKRTRNEPNGIGETEGRGLLWDGVGGGVSGACALPIEGEEMEEEEVIYVKTKERKESWESIRSEGRESLNLMGVGRGTQDRGTQGTSLTPKQMRERAKEIGIVIHVPEMPPYTKMFREELTNNRKEEMLLALYRGEAKIAWQKEHTSLDRDKILKALRKMQFLPQDIGYRMEKREIYTRLVEKARVRTNLI